MACNASCSFRTVNRVDRLIANLPALTTSCVDLELRSLRSAGITRRQHYYGPLRHPRRPSLLVTELSLKVTRLHRWGFPCCLSIPLPHMPSPLPRRDRLSFVALGSASGGLPCRSGRSAPALRVSRLAQRSLTLRPAWLLTPQGSLLQECFSLHSYLRKPLQVLPVGATSYRAGFAPAGINMPFTAHRPTHATRN